MLRFVGADFLAIIFIGSAFFIYYKHRVHKRSNKIKAYFSGGTLAHQSRRIPGITKVVTFEGELYRYSPASSSPKKPVYVFIGQIPPDPLAEVFELKA